MKSSFQTSADANRGAYSPDWNFEHILRLYDAKCATGNASDLVRRCAQWIAAREASQALDAARAIARENFAASHGWRVAIRPFTIAKLRAAQNIVGLDHRNYQLTPMDHTEYFRQDSRPWRPIAIVSHEYSSFEYSLALASAQGLVAELLPESWYFPGHCRAVLYTASQDSMQ
jgi:hypothetical protein